MIKSYIDSFKDRKRALIFISDILFLVFIVMATGIFMHHTYDSSLIEQCQKTGKFEAVTLTESYIISCSVD